MKQFKDLKIGDTICINAEKKSIVDITPDPLFEDYDFIKIYTSNGNVYVVPGYEASCRDYSKDNMLIAVDKEAIIKHCTDTLRDLQIDYEDNKAFFEKILERARTLE